MRIAPALCALLIWQAAGALPPEFSPVQSDVFAAAWALSNAWADVDDDGDADLAVSFSGGEIRLYRNDSGRFVNVGGQLGFPKEGSEARSLAWGDFDADGDVDLFAAAAGVDGAVGAPGQPPARSLLLRNDEARGFVDVAASQGVAYPGPNSRQASWIDYDSDGDLDLFVAQRSSENRLYRNDDKRFLDVSDAAKLDDPRRTVGACWFDADRDGDLDLFLANQQGDKDALYRNDHGVFTDIAAALGMHQPQRSLREGGVGCAPGDFDNDGDFDLLVAAYGVSHLYRNEQGVFHEVAQSVGLGANGLAVGASWGDYDNDGLPDLYLTAYRHDGDLYQPLGHLFRNAGGRFEEVLTADSALRAADHGVQWADFDRDGDLDLSMTESYSAEGHHPVLRNQLPEAERGKSLQVSVLDRYGHYTRAGAEVRLFSAAGNLLGTRLVPTGDGYGSQSATPVHFGLAAQGPVTVEVTFMTSAGRRKKTLAGIDPRKRGGSAIELRQDP